MLFCDYIRGAQAVSYFCSDFFLFWRAYVDFSVIEIPPRIGSTILD